MRRVIKSWGWDGKHYPEIHSLIVKFGGISRAEVAAGLANGTIGKIRDGKAAFTDLAKRRVMVALQPDYQPEGKTMAAPHFEVPETCPPLLADLLRAEGSKLAVRRFLKCGDSALNSAIKGGPIPEEWAVKIKAKLGQPVIGPTTEAPPQRVAQVASAPEFVAWDGSMATVTCQALGGKTVRIKAPTPVALLFEKFQGSRTKAAASMGRSLGWWTPILQDPKAKFKERHQLAVHYALHGIKPPSQNSMGEDYDKYELGLAICMVPANSFDRIQELADILNGTLKFRKNTKAGGWLLIYYMPNAADLSKFKRLALRDANEIVCP